MQNNNVCKVTVLSDNTASGQCESEHGLSLYIEYEDDVILLDTGRSALFNENAKKLGVDLNKVTTAVLSHSHYDHSDGFDTFFEINKNAKLYVRAEAGECFYSNHDGEYSYIGPKQGMFEKYRDRIVYVDSKKQTLNREDEILIPHNTDNLEEIGARVKLFRKRNDKYMPDDFNHEQTLLLDTPKGIIIFNSCSHGGAANIVKEVMSFAPGKKIYAYLGGFHLLWSSDEEVEEFAETLKSVDVTHIVTGHCTGERAYEILSANLGDKVRNWGAGMCIEL